MDSAETPSHSHLLRSKRTRNTSTGDDSIKQPATKKRRSALRRDTFEPLTDSSLNEIAGRSQSTAHTNGTSVEPAQSPTRTASQTRELTVRGGKKTEKRAERGQGLLTLSTNDFYTVAQLPALPEQIRSRPTVSYSCVISPENDYILALTHTDALVWSYNTSASTPTSRELLNFKLPFPPAITEDPLPLAAFTTKSANGEPGIVVVSPKWGKVVYWETLSSASAYAPAQSNNGVQGTIPGMFSGEVVNDLVPAEPAGFILSLASGRVAQLTVRDQMGRPAIGIQFMRKAQPGSVRGGIFGSIRNAFGGDRRKGTAIARPAKVAKAQRDIIVCTDDAEFEFWTNNLLTGNQLLRTINVKDHLLAALGPQLEQDNLRQPLQFKLVDFCPVLSPVSRELTRRDDTESTALLVLAAISSQARTFYYLLETTIADNAAHVKVVRPIRGYTDDIAHNQGFQPRICAPHTSPMAFVLFAKAIVTLSLARISETPSSQLLGERSALPTPFQDCIRLQDNNLYRIINFAAEDGENGPCCVAAVQGFGIVRITSHMSHDDELDFDEVTSQLSAKTRIEQAIFFGVKQSNPLDLKRSNREAYSAQDVRQAVLEISREVLKSTSKHISKSASSIAEHLQQRARALQDLIEYSLKTYPECISRDDRFMLLWNAEKIAAAQALWKVQEKIQATYPRDDDREMTYLNFALSALSEKRQKYPKPEKGEIDHVRHWLIHSVVAVDKLLVELEDSMHELGEMHLNDPKVICDYYLEGTELWSAAFHTAFKFREDNAAVYGLGNETYRDGVLMSGYPLTLPLSWTSNTEQVTHGQNYVQDVCRFLSEWWNVSPSQHNGTANPKPKKTKQIPVNLDGEPYDIPSKVSLSKLADHLPSQVNLVNRVVLEANTQHRAQVEGSDESTEQKQRQLKALEGELRQIVSKAITSFAPFNQDGAIALAEAQHDTNLLVELNLNYLADLSRTLKAHPDNEHVIMQNIRGVQDHVETYFDQFGNDWAYSHFSNMIERGELGRLLGEGQLDGGKKQQFLTWFFETAVRRDKHLGKVAWINNIIGEKRYDSACQTLELVADVEETDIWSKKTELCLAKLAGFAALERGKSSINETKIDRYAFELEYLHIVESLVFHINATLFDAVDDDAAVDLAMQRYMPSHLMNNKKAQQQRKYLGDILRKIVTNQMPTLNELIDALTLLQIVPLDPEQVDIDFDDISGAEYLFALQAIDLATSREANEQQKDNLRKTVWRRLLIKDHWTELNQTAGKSDEQVKQVMQRTVLFTTLIDLIRRAEDEDIEIHIPSVDEVLEIGKAKEDGSLNDKLNEDTRIELATLRKYVDKARLKDHFGGLVGEAKDELRSFRDSQGEAFARDASESQLTNGHSHDGNVNGDHS